MRNLKYFEKGVPIMAGKNQYVGPNGEHWQVKGENNSKPTKLFDTKADAVNYGRDIAKNQKSELTIQNKNGQISSKDSYGNDPMPPRDKN